MIREAGTTKPKAGAAAREHEPPPGEGPGLFLLASLDTVFFDVRAGMPCIVRRYRTAPSQ